MISVRNKSKNKNKCEIHLILKENATKKDLLLGLIHSYLVRYSMKTQGYSGGSNFNFLEKFNQKNVAASESTYRVLVRTRELLYDSNSNRNDSNNNNSMENNFVSNNEINNINNSNNNFENSNYMNHSSIKNNNSNNNNTNNTNSNVRSSPGLGVETVVKILDSQWLVEELLLETRRARIEVKKQI